MSALPRSPHNDIIAGMPLHRTDLADFNTFLALARHRNFRRAGEELGVSASALSHALKGLEARMGVRLLNRTNRSVTLTAAGEELQAALAGPFAAIGEAVERLERLRELPAGRIRLNVPEHAASLLLAPVLPLFADRYPDIQVEVEVSNALQDVVGDGFDAGIRYGGTVPEDMIARRLSADILWGVASAPSYFARFGVPVHPHDLANHRCLRVRLGNGTFYRWEFEREGEVIALDVPGAITMSNTAFALDLIRQGAALAYMPVPCFAEAVARGELRTVLDEWRSPSEGFYIYYPGRRQVPVGLRLLVEMIREVQPLGL